MVEREELGARARANFIVRPRVPQIALLGYMDAVLCRAGHNAVCEALSFGLPLVVAPIRDDQPIVARQVIDAGAGLFMRYGKVTVATARAAVEEVLREPGYRHGALRLRESFPRLGGASHAPGSLQRYLQGENSAPNRRIRAVPPGPSHAVG